VSIYFAKGAYRLDPNARKLIDEFADTLVELGNTYVTVEGYTDDSGAPETHGPLSERRAQAVVDYLVAQRRLDRARFRVIGRGMLLDRDNTEEGREKNRRTDFKLYENSH
jgi:outer membrane protein OmpA-like peptidoglycan-associated protein